MNSEDMNAKFQHSGHNMGLKVNLLHLHLDACGKAILHNELSSKP
jgi:hypothetical protein